MKILIIEDDVSTCEAIRLSLEIFDPVSTLAIAEKGRAGLEKVREEHFDVVVLDLGLPDIDGFEVLKKLRTFSQTPVLIVSGRHDPEIITNALKEGAQDFILKPFNTQVFIRSLKDLCDISKPKQSDFPTTKITEYFSVNCETHEAQFNGEIVVLDTGEWQVLDCLIDHWGRLVPLKTLGEIISSTETERVQLVHQTVNRLRKKLGDDIYRSKIILSEFGCGYRLVKPKT
jgi:DNA-binding response OmpR family regulator